MFGRIVVPSSSLSSGVCLDPEDDGTSHTATQCPIPKDLNLPTSTFGNLDSPSVYILPSCVIFVTESSTMLCVDTISGASVWCLVLRVQGWPEVVIRWFIKRDSSLVRITADDIHCDAEACGYCDGWVRHLVEVGCMIHCGYDSKFYGVGV